MAPYDNCVGVPISCILTIFRCLFSIVSYVKALAGAFNQEKALVGAFSVIVKTDGSFAALVTSLDTGRWSHLRHFPARAAAWRHFIILLESVVWQQPPYQHISISEDQSQTC